LVCFEFGFTGVHSPAFSTTTQFIHMFIFLERTMSIARPLSVRASMHSLDPTSLAFQNVAKHFWSTADMFEIAEICKLFMKWTLSLGLECFYVGFEMSVYFGCF